MHRPLLIAALGFVLAALPLSAQRGGGGHASGGGHAGFGGHMGGGGHAFGGMRSGSGFAGRSFARGSSFGRGFSHGTISTRGRNRSGVGLRLRTYGYGRNCGGYGCGWGYGYGYPYLYGGIDPYWWWDNDSSDSDPDPGPQYDNGLANQMNEQGLYPRQGFYPRPMPGDQDAHARSASPPQEASSTAVPATVLVFRDQRKQEVQNYAIVGQTLWAFAPQRTQKIPLSDLDLPATIKANDERGVDFKVPGSGEGQ